MAILGADGAVLQVNEKRMPANDRFAMTHAEDELWSRSVTCPALHHLPASQLI
jgi:hypothetical protein